MVICPICKEKHNGNYGSGLFCSKRCSCSYKNISGIVWKCRICGENFISRRKLQKHRKELHNICNNRYNKGNHSWNYGLTVENSDIVRKTTEKIKDMYRNGEIINPLKGKKLDPIIKQKISQTMSKLNSLKEFNLGRSEVKWFYIKNINNIEFCVRGTWEYNVAKILNENNINWIRNHSLKYKIDNVLKTYNPDFYLPNEDIYIEVKGWFKNDDIIKMNCVQTQYPNMKIYFIDEKYYWKFINKKIFLIDDMLYINHEKFIHV